MDQNNSKIPNFGDHSQDEQLKIRVEGVITHGHAPKRRVFLSYQQPGSTNTVVETIMRTIIDVCGGNLNKVPPIIFVQLDNTSSTNKNNIQVAVMAALVELGIVREVWLNFLPVGHTHEDIDQMFSVISHAFDYNPPRSLPEMMEIIRGIGKEARTDSRELDLPPGVCKAELGRIEPFVLSTVPDYKVNSLTHSIC